MGIDFDDLKNVANDGAVDQAAEFAKSRFGDERPAGDDTPRSEYGRHATENQDYSPSADERGSEENFAGGRYDQGSTGGYGEPSGDTGDSERGYGG